MSLAAEHTPDVWFRDAATLLGTALRLAVTVRFLTVAVIGLFVMILGWRLVGMAFLPLSPEGPETGQAQRFHVVATSWQNQPEEPFVIPAGAESGTRPIDPVCGVAYRLVEPFRRLFLVGRNWATLAYYLSGGIWSLSVWAFFGAIISRMAATRYTGHPGNSLREAIRFAARKWWACFCAPTWTLLAIAMLAVPLVALGWLMRFDAGIFMAGLLWSAVLCGGLLMGVLSLGLMFGWPLMWGAVSCEDADAFDAISRAYAYVFQSPLAYGVYAVLAVVLGWTGWGLAWWMSESVIQLGYWGVSLGAGNQRVMELMQLVDSVDAGDAPVVLHSGALLVRIAVQAVRAVGSGFSFSFFWAATTAVYLLLRRDTDHTPLDEIAGAIARVPGELNSHGADSAAVEESG